MIRFCIALLVVGHGRALQFISKIGRIDPAWIKCRRLRQPSGPKHLFHAGSGVCLHSQSTRARIPMSATTPQGVEHLETIGNLLRHVQAMFCLGRVRVPKDRRRF